MRTGAAIEDQTAGDAGMSGIARTNSTLDAIVSVLTRAAQVLLLALTVVALVSVIALIIGGTYGLLHNGDDFDFDISGGGGTSDIIDVRGVLN